MRRAPLLAFLATATALAVAGPLATGPAEAQQSCSAYREACEAVCTPERAARYYAGSLRRCRSSCEPRWSQCLRSGYWADIEALRTGWWERAARY